jgi:hypothetical protein
MTVIATSLFSKNPGAGFLPHLMARVGKAGLKE